MYPQSDAWLMTDMDEYEDLVSSINEEISKSQSMEDSLQTCIRRLMSLSSFCRAYAMISPRPFAVLSSLECLCVLVTALRLRSVFIAVLVCDLCSFVS